VAGRDLQQTGGVVAFSCTFHRHDDVVKVAFNPPPPSANAANTALPVK